MGDKISALPAASSVDGTEVIPIVQGGATKKVTGTILRSPTGSAGGDLAGSYPNPTLAAVTTAQSNVGSQSAIPVVSIDAKGRVVALSTVANPALTTNQIAGLTTVAGAALATAGAAGLSTFAARADHQHARPTPGEIGALSATAAAGGDLTGNFPNPTLAAITTSQSNVGSSTAVPVISIDAKGRVTALATAQFSALTTAQIAGLSTAAPAALATAAAAGLSTFAARGDHQHALPTAGQVGAIAVGATAGGDLTGTLPSPSLASITTAKSNIGSSTVVPVISVDAKGRVTSLTTAQIAGGGGGGISALTGDVLASGTGSVAATLTSITTAQSNVGSSTAIPVIDIDAKGRVVALTTTAIAGGSSNATAIQGIPVSATTPTQDHGLVYNAGQWESGYPLANAAYLRGVPVTSTSPSNGQVLTYDGSNWTPAAVSAPQVPEWNSGLTYNAGDAVVRYNVVFIAAQSVSAGLDPASNGVGYWRMATGTYQTSAGPVNISTPAGWLFVNIIGRDPGSAQSFIPFYE